MDTVNEIELQQRTERRQVFEDADLFHALMASKEWKRYLSLVEAVAQNYHAAVMRPIESTNEVVKLEFAKGVLNGLTLATSLPQMKITEAHNLRRTEDE